MAIPAAAKGSPIPKVNGIAAFVEPATGALTSHGLQVLSAWYEFIVGMNRVTPCSATNSGANLITLTPNAAAPLIEKYVDYEVFAFRAPFTSTGSVTATVVPRKGALATLAVYIAGGATRAGAGDVVLDSVYLAVYADHLDTGAGGLVLK